MVRSEVVYKGTASAVPWSFYIFSRGGGVDHAWLRDCEAERSQELRLFSHFCAQHRDQVQAGRPPGVTPPLWQCGIGASTACAEGL